MPPKRGKPPPRPPKRTRPDSDDGDDGDDEDRSVADELAETRRKLAKALDELKAAQSAEAEHTEARRKWIDELTAFRVAAEREDMRASSAVALSMQRLPQLPIQSV